MGVPASHSRCLGFHLIEHPPTLAAHKDFELYFLRGITGLVGLNRSSVHASLFEDIYSATLGTGHDYFCIDHLSIGSIILYSGHPLPRIRHYGEVPETDHNQNYFDIRFIKSAM